MCLRACARQEDEERKCTSKQFHGQHTGLGTLSAAVAVAAQVEEGKRLLLHRPLVVPLHPSCNALTQSQRPLSPFPLSRVHRALSPLALNMLLRASCQRRSKVPSPTTYCRDTLFFLAFFLSFSPSHPLLARLCTRSFSAATCATKKQDRGFPPFGQFRSTKSPTESFTPFPARAAHSLSLCRFLRHKN